MGVYNFNVSALKDVDYKRIIDENPDQKVIVVGTPKAKTCIVLIKREFIATFERGDNIVIGKEVICRSNNYDSHFYMRQAGHKRITYKDEYSVTGGDIDDLYYVVIPIGWVAIMAYASTVDVQVSRALAYKRKIKISVQLGDAYV